MLHLFMPFCWTGYDDTNCNWKKRKLPIYVGELAFSVLGKAARFWAFAPEVQFCSSDFLEPVRRPRVWFLLLAAGCAAAEDAEGMAGMVRVIFSSVLAAAAHS